MFMSTSVSDDERVPAHLTTSADKEDLKIWQVWPGNHTFLCDGRLMLGPDIGVTACAFALTTGTSIGFWIFVCPSVHLAFFLVGLALYVQTIAFMALTATTDPASIDAGPSD